MPRGLPGWRGGLAVVALFVACSSTPQSSDSQVVSQQPDEEADAGDEGAEAEEASGRGRHFWGGIQDRADSAYDELEAQIQECLHSLDSAGQVREIALRARRRGWGGYELEQLMTKPRTAIGEPCVEEVSRNYVTAVGRSFGDDFETYMATFIARPAEDGACGEASQVVCVEIDAEVADGEQEEGGECDEALVNAVNAAFFEGRHCTQAGRYQDYLREHEDRPLWLRAVVFGEILVGQGEIRVSVGYNQPWVEEMARCFADEVAQVKLEEPVVRGECRSTVRNRALTYTMEPVFTYVVD